MKYIKVENLKFSYPLVSPEKNLNFKGKIGGNIQTRCKK